VHLPVVRFVILICSFLKLSRKLSHFVFITLSEKNILINITNQDFTVHYRSTCVFNNFIYLFMCLSTMVSFRSLSLSARISHNTMAEIVYGTCDAIWNRLMKRYMHLLRKISSKRLHMSSKRNGIFLITWEQMTENVRIRCPQGTGSQFYNYKSYFSIHLQAIVDAKYKYVTVDIGAFGRQSDSGVFTESNVFRHLEAGPF